MPKAAPVSQEQIENAVLLLRGEKVLLDSSLAELYGVTTKALNQAVKRNQSRFPSDFMFRLSAKETTELNRSQTVTGSQKHRDPRYAPFAFTEQGVAMLSSVLRSERAVQVNIEIMRAFVRLRQLLAVNADLAHRLEDLERRVGSHDEQFVHVIRAIRQLMDPPAAPKRRRIGFDTSDDESSAEGARRLPTKRDGRSRLRIGGTKRGRRRPLQNRQVESRRQDPRRSRQDRHRSDDPGNEAGGVKPV